MRFLIGFRIQWPAVIALVGATTTAVGCGSPMKMVKPSGMATGSPYAISGTEVPGIPVPVVAIADVSSRGVGGKDPVTTNESGLFVVAEDVMQGDGTVLVKTGARVNARVTRKEHTGLGRPGWLEVAFLSTQSTSGAPVRLDERPVRFEGESRLYMSKGGDVTLQAGSTFMPIGSILELPGLP